MHQKPIEVRSKDSENDAVTFKVEVLPDCCPQCGCHIGPIQTGLAFDRWSPFNTVSLEVVLRCPRLQCSRLFIASYSRSDYSSGDVLSLKSTAPTQIRDLAFPAIICEVSPAFAEIFNEGHKAEQMGWKLACGPAYRKALEFLIKDYSIRLHPLEEDKIKGTPLGQCIKDYVKNVAVNKVAERAVWLGNDETHYQRKWVGKDLEDLKKLIQLTLHWIEMEELTKEATDSMPEVKKASV
jgi:hypothetical protein